MIYWTLGKFLKPLAAINLPKSPTFLGNFCKGVRIYHFSSEIISAQLLWIFGDFFLSFFPINLKMLANQYIFKHIFDVFQVIHDISQADSGEYTCRIMVRERDIISLTHQVSVASAFTVKPVHKIFSG